MAFRTSLGFLDLDRGFREFSVVVKKDREKEREKQSEAEANRSKLTFRASVQRRDCFRPTASSLSIALSFQRPLLPASHPQRDQPSSYSRSDRIIL